MTIDILLIGKGKWGKNYISILNNFSNVILTVATRDNWRTLVSTKKYQGVIVATPPQTHVDIAKVILESDTPVMIEKPLALSFSEVELLRQYSAPILINHIHLFSQRYQEIKNQVKNLDILIIDVGPRPDGKHDINDLMDYGSHSIALSIDIARQFPRSIICRKNDRTYDIQLLFDRSSSKITVGYTEKRVMYLSTLKTGLTYDGTFYDETDRPLTNALEVFIGAIDGQPDYRLGLDYPSKVVQILEECQAQILK